MVLVHQERLRAIFAPEIWRSHSNWVTSVVPAVRRPPWYDQGGSSTSMDRESERVGESRTFIFKGKREG